MPRGYNCKRNKQSLLGCSNMPWGYPMLVPRARAAHPASPWERRPDSLGLHAGEHPSGSRGPQRCLGLSEKGDAEQAKTAPCVPVTDETKGGGF